MKMMMFFSSLLSFLIMKTNNPMMFTILILAQALVLCLILCFIMKTSWFSYILFLIFLGGLMIIFSYVCSLASNESINIEMKMSSLVVVVTISFLGMLQISESNNLLQNDSIENFFKMLSKLIMFPTIISMFYLLFTLIVIVKISFKNMGSLRSSKK